jgi:hypothetical protein
MTTAAAVQPIQQHIVAPASDRREGGERPTETRYGWCPYGDINLVNGDGTINLYVQPHQIDAGGQTVQNPYHRSLPKNQLVPFPTFSLVEQMPSPDQRDARGRALLVDQVRTVTALDAAAATSERYARWGFTIFNSLQGLEQEQAFRIFQVVQPLNYLLRDLVGELEFGAPQRIDATEPIEFPEVPGYSVEPLRNENERAIARRLVDEMLVGAGIAVDLATETLNQTETSMVARHSGGQGKTGPDPLDRRLSAELGRALPQLIGAPKESALEAKVDMLVDHARTQQLAEENARMREELDALRNGNVPTEAEPIITCGAIKGNGEPCGIQTKGGPCGLHK